MYGWIVDGISSLFEPVSGQTPTEWPGKGNVSEKVPTRLGVKAGAQRQDNHGRPAKRNYQRSVVEDKDYFSTLSRCPLILLNCWYTISVTLPWLFNDLF